MRRYTLVWLLTGTLGGCATVGSLESSSIRHEWRANQLALLGDGAGAARARDRAVADHEAAKLKAGRGGYWVGEVLLE
jgi:hypothetical protein